MKRMKQPQPIDLYVGQRIRRRRVELGVSQETLARGLKISFQQVQKYEKGTNRVGGSRLAQIATILEVPPEYFFDGAPGLMRSKPWQDKYASALARSDVQRLLDKYLLLDAGKRNALLNLVEAW